jgi:N-acetylmuramic acid 6-phosphate etherase
MADYSELIKLLNNLQTEQINPNSVEIDKKDAIEIARIINDEDKKVTDVVESQLENIAKTAELFASTIRTGGRVFYVGAGTSGRLGVLDAAECPPTFGTDPDKIVGLISGGYDTLVLSKEGVEDDIDAAVGDLENNNIRENDLVIGIAASRRTPYTISGLKYAKMVGCSTVFIICNRWDESVEPDFIDILIELDVGPEVITGSTRMKSGTAQKLTLNMISTTAMVLLGKTYGNLMVDLVARSDKLAARSLKILIDLFKIPNNEAEKLLNQAHGSVKKAIVIYQFKCNEETAEKLLENSNGFISKIKKGE